MNQQLVETMQKVRANKQKAFVPYIMAGDGGLDTLVEKLELLQRLGATAIEVGIPFSDPVADGPTIQRAGIRALHAGTTLRNTLNVLKKGKETIIVPIIIMTYLNPVLSYGLPEYIRDLNEAGISGCIIPDLPIEEEELLAPHLDAANIELIRLVTMTTPKERIKEIASRGNGFLYTVTIKGITGARSEFDENVLAFLKMVSELSPIPVLAGFGISTAEQIKEITNYCDGVIVGSKIVESFEKNDLDVVRELFSAHLTIEK